MTRISSVAYLIAAGLFLAGVTLQVFLAGMVVVAGHRAHRRGGKRSRSDKYDYRAPAGFSVDGFTDARW